MNNRVQFRSLWLAVLWALGSWSVWTPLPAVAQPPVPGQVQVNNQNRIKTKLLYLLPDFMTWDVHEKEKGDVWIAVITHGNQRADFDNEIAKEQLKKTKSGRTVHWVKYNTPEALLADQANQAHRWHIIFIWRTNEKSTEKDLEVLDKHFGERKGVVLVTEENTRFFSRAAINFYEDVALNRIRMQLRNLYLRETIGVTPKEEMLAIEGVLIYDKKK